MSNFPTWAAASWPSWPDLRAMRPRVCHGGNPNKKLDIHKHNDMKSRLIYSMILYIIHFYIYSLGSCWVFPTCVCFQKKHRPPNQASCGFVTGGVHRVWRPALGSNCKLQARSASMSKFQLSTWQYLLGTLANTSSIRVEFRTNYFQKQLANTCTPWTCCLALRGLDVVRLDTVNQGRNEQRAKPLLPEMNSWSVQRDKIMIS